MNKQVEKHFIVEQIDRDYSLIQIFCTEEGVGEVLPGVIKKDFKFEGTWPEVKRELLKRSKENNEAEKDTNGLSKKRDQSQRELLEVKSS